jgi:hypothetical protein
MMDMWENGMIWINLQLPYTLTPVVKQSGKQFLHMLLVF